MGKGNRVRLSKAQQAASNESVFAAKKEKKGTPAWVMTLVTILVIALLLACVALSVISEGGYILRWTKVVESENYSVNGTMMSYYFYQNYNYFLSRFGSYLQYVGLETGTSLKEQEQAEGVSWFDYFMDPAIEEAEKMLVYCEEAKARGIKLDDEDYKLIDESIATLEETAKTAGYSLNSYITAVYGVGVKKQDIRKSLELSQLASKCSEAVSDDFLSQITEDEITNYYNENSGKFMTADVLSYSFKAVESEGSDYNADKTAVNADAEALKACKTEEDFRKYVAQYVAEDGFDDTYASKTKDYEASVLPDAATLAVKKAEIIASTVSNALAGKDTPVSTGTDTVSIVLYNTELALTTSVKTALDGLLSKGVAFTDAEEEDADEAGIWMSDTARKKGDTTVVTDEDTEPASDSSASDVNNYTATVYMMVEPMHRDDTNARNVGHILFTTDTYETAEAASAKADEILAKFKAGEMTKEAFQALGDEYTEDSSVFYEDVIPGQMVAAFNDWLFDSARKVGDTGVVQTDYGYHVMYYMGENTELPAWRVSTKNSIHSEKIDTWFESSVTSFGVTTNTDAAEKISA